MNDTHDSSISGNTAEPAAGAAPAGTYYAHKTIIHDGRLIQPDGRPLPADFPPESLQRLLRDKAIGEKPPGASSVSFSEKP